MDCVIIYDTEVTAWEGSLQRGWSLDWEFKEVIQIGAVKAKVSTSEISEIEHLLLYVKPEKNRELSEYIQKLTGITQGDIIQMGISFCEALNEFYEFCDYGRIACYSWFRDDKALIENCELNGIKMHHFSGGFSDLREVFIQKGHDVNGYSSGTISSKYGIEIEGNAHNALHDSRSLLAAVNCLFKSASDKDRQRLIAGWSKLG